MENEYKVYYREELVIRHKGENKLQFELYNVKYRKYKEQKEEVVSKFCECNFIVEQGEEKSVIFKLINRHKSLGTKADRLYERVYRKYTNKDYALI